MNTQKRRGRPKKIKTEEEPIKEIGIAKKRGRPKKVELKYDVKPQKRYRINKEASRASETTLFGPEPTWEAHLKTQDEYDNALGFALNWYNACTVETRKKKWVLEYVEKNPALFPKNTFAALEKVPDRMFTTIGALVRCLSRGCKLSEKHQEWIISYVKKVINENVPKKEITEKVVLPTSRRIDPIHSKLIESVEKKLDEFIVKRNLKILQKFDFTEQVQTIKADASQVRFVQKYFTDRVTELNAALEKEALYKEAYSHFSKVEMQAMIEFYKNLEKAVEVAPKKQRKPRRKKIYTPEQILRKFQFKKADDQFKIKSIDPEDILNVDELWIFNCKTRKIGFFKGLEGGIQVKGTSLRNYDENNSYTKKLRKPQEFLEKLKSLHKPACKKLIESIRAKQSAIRSRIGQDVILVRAF